MLSCLKTKFPTQNHEKKIKKTSIFMSTAYKLKKIKGHTLIFMASELQR